MDLLKKIFPFTGIIIFLIIIFNYLNFKLLFKLFCKINIYFLLLAAISTFFITYFKIFRIYKILTRNNIFINVIEFFKIYSVSYMLSQISNLLLSETSAALATMINKKRKFKIGNIFLVTNLIDFFTIFNILLISAFLSYSSIRYHIRIQILQIKLLILICIVILIILFFIFFLNFIKKFLFEIKNIMVKSFNIMIFYTFLIYIFYIFTCIFEAKALNIKLDIFYLLFVYSLGSIITVIPISINGLGTREALFIFFLKQKGIPNEIAFSLSFIGYIILPLISYISIYFYTFLRRKNESKYHN